MVKFIILKWKDYIGLTWKVQHNLNRYYKRGAGGSEPGKEMENVEAEVERMHRYEPCIIENL